MEPEAESAASAESSSGEAAVPARRARLWNRDFGLVLSGQTVSQLGNQAFSVAMAFWLVEATGSASLMGLLLTASSLPGVLLGPVGGAVADRFNRIKIAVAADLVGGVAMTGLALVMFSGRASTSALVALFFAVAVLMGTVRAFFLPALGAAIPDLVPPDRLAAGNSLTQLTAQGALLVGQGVGGILYSLLGAPLLFLFDGLSYLVAAGSEAFVRLPPPRSPDAGEAGAGLRHVFRRFWTDIKEAMAYVKATRGLLGFVLAAAGYNFFLMPIVVLLPFFVADYLGRGARWYGFLLAGISAGEILGFVLAGVVRLRGRAKANFLIALMVLAPTPFALIGFIRSAPVALAVAVALGAAIGMINVHVMTIMQASTPQELRGRVMGLLGTLGGAVIPVGMALGGIAGDLTGKNIPLVYTTCGIASFVFTLATLLRSGTRDFLARD
jgi:MFS transporter, DHA3 family, macrolide efflux protein